MLILGQRHFDESVTLDSLPLTDPEHFGNNVQVSKDVFASGIFTTDDTHTGWYTFWCTLSLQPRKPVKALNSPCISDNDDETDQSGSSIEVKSEENKLLEEKPKTIVCICMFILFKWLTIFKETKKESQIKVEDTPSTSSIAESKFKPEVHVDDNETNEQLLKKLNKEFSLDEKELRELDGPEEVSTIFF